ncbi:MAG: nucleoside-diphosphate kinase [bacterium]|nr:nucleoside-diphosphate kinase [bacterium]
MSLKEERTLVIIKPDGVQRSLIGEIIRRYERSGLKMTALKMLIPSSELVKRHYSVDPEWGMKTGSKTIAAYQKAGKQPPSEDPLVIAGIIFEKLQKYMVTGPVVAMVWQGIHAIGIVRKITGGTEPLTSDVGTIRGDLTIDSYVVADTDKRAVRNLIHASGSVDEAENEIPIWFKAEELSNYRLLNEEILYDVNFDSVLE